MSHFSALLESIPHKFQRYDTCGDWLCGQAPRFTVRVSELPDWRYEALVAVHELVEAIMCFQAGIDMAKVDDFDLHYAPGPNDPIEPGDSRAAPYHHEHLAATEVERFVADKLSVDWDAYEKCLYELDWGKGTG